MAVNDEYMMPGDVFHTDGSHTGIVLIDAGKDDETGGQLWELKLVSGNGIYTVTEIPAEALARIGSWLAMMAGK